MKRQYRCYLADFDENKSSEVHTFTANNLNHAKRQATQLLGFEDGTWQDGYNMRGYKMNNPDKQVDWDLQWWKVPSGIIIKLPRIVLERIEL